MRLLVANWARGAVGGVETYLRGVVPTLIARGHTVAMLFEHRFEAAAAAPDPYANCVAEWCVESLGTGAALAAARAWRPELVWIHGLRDTDLETGLLALAPAALFAHNYDGTCATGEKLRRWPRPRPCTRILGPGCAVVNFTQHCGRVNPAGFASTWRRQQQRRRALTNYRRILVASRHMALEFQRHVASPEQVQVVGLPRREPREAAPTPRSELPIHVLMMGRLTSIKGGKWLLRAIAQAEHVLHRRLRLTVAGDGPERPRLCALARQLNLDAEFPGWIDSEERRRRLGEADVLAVPSLWPEPFGLVGIEAAGYGVPAVAFAVGGIPDWLRTGRSGELAPGNPPKLAGLTAALVRVLGDKAHWEHLRQGAWEVAAEFELDPHLDRLEAAFAGTRAGS